MFLKKTRILGTLIVLTLIVSLLGGCGKKESVDSSNVGKDGKVATKRLHLTMWSAQDTDYIASEVPKKNIVKSWLTKETNVDLDNIFGNGGGSLDSKLTQLLAADNLPHMLRTNALTHLAKLNEAEKLWTLTPEMMQEYAPNVWEKIPDYMWEQATVNGKIMGIPFNLGVQKGINDNISEKLYDAASLPNSDAMFAAHTSVWVRDDILKKIYPEAKTYDELVELLNEKNEPIGEEIMDVPIKTTEDYVDFFYKIKELELKEGDKPVYAFGYNGGDNWMALSFFGADLMGYRGHFYTGSWDPINERVRMNLLEPIFKESALVQNRLIRDRVFEPESLVHTQAQFVEKVKNGLYACAILSYVGQPDIINKELKDAGKDFQYRPLYTQIPNKKEYPDYNERPTWYDMVGLLKTIKEEDLPQVLNWIDVQFTDEFEDVYYWGTKEEGLYTEENGKRKFKDEKFNKYFVDMDTSKSNLSEFDGLANDQCTVYTRFMLQSEYYPVVYNDNIKYLPTNMSGFKFKMSSPHVKDLKYFPPAHPWSPEFSEIPELQEFWNARQQWEDPFKLVFVAKSDEEFNEKWQKATDTLKSITDIDKMLDQMTEIAKKEADKLKELNK